MPKCCDCAKDVPKSAFAKSQLKKKPNLRRCLVCAVTKDTKKVGNGADKKHADPPSPDKAADNGDSKAAAVAAAAVEEMAKKAAEAKAKKEAEKAEKAKKEAAAAEAKKEAVAAKAKMEAAAKAKKEAANAKKEAARSKKEAATAEKKAAAPAKAEVAPEPPQAADSSASESPSLPPGLEASLPLLTPSQRDLARKMCSEPASQSHLFSGWSASSTADADAKRAFMARLETVDNTYPTGGLMGYISNARDLLDKSRRGVNPLEGWKPSVPAGQNFDDTGSKEFKETEEVGRKELGRCGFVLVAGGLGERLGYGDIKIGLPTELATETCYVQYYIETILAYQSKYAPAGTKLPLCIMTSGDTNSSTVSLLEKNNYFGMDRDQVTFVQQGDGVPALVDNDARIAVDPSDPYKIQSKPHGHGDVHALIHSEGVAKKWMKAGVKWAVLFQDTNGLAFHTLPLSLGVSVKLGLVMNSTAVPRKGKQAVGGIAKLTKESGEQRTLNVEYNQLDPLLRATGFPDGDVNDEKTGYSPFPGNINQLLFELEPYAAALERTNGAMPEFVNPKYKDSSKTAFKKPTRLECMMQDFPTVLTGKEAERVGFTSAPAGLCFSPVKNATADGAKLQAKGTHPGVAASGEADQYAALRSIMTSAGCKVEEAEPVTYDGISVVPGPEIVLKPSFMSCPGECGEKFPSPEKVKISAGSSLVVDGSGVVIESLDLDGALVIRCEEGATGTIRDLVVNNKGWEKVVDESLKNEVIAMRGYHMKKIETKTIIFKEDGSVEGYAAPVAVEISKAKSNSTSLPSLTEPASKETEEKTSDCNCVIS
mmetsp:Transcript_41249/g.124724  ORF Transcript_41249/g.124724 Transcript_41249/m.124724 type:complete len:822 (-) Transcript_41249:445-2910(-)